MRHVIQNDGAFGNHSVIFRFLTISTLLEAVSATTVATD